ncbi:MAG: peptidase M6 immune inhibitor A, partial [Actinoplanes sp.]
RYRPGPQPRTAAAGTPAAGTVREWFGMDERTGEFYRKNYTLRAVGRHIEVWVAQDIAFPAGDCRENAMVVTDAQVHDLVQEFDETIYPKETAAFSTPPDRNGTGAQTAGDFTGDGDKTVTLVDNIRDENYFAFPQAVTYVAGFFSNQLNELVDRNVMTIDAYDWKHRLGARPADEPTDDLCTSRPARPRLYDATFAHEWQHLLGYYADPNEETWVNEGLSDFAQTLVGYVDGRAGVHDYGNDSHLICFQGFGPVKTQHNAIPRDCGGPQNSLNLWNEGTPSEVLADYGIVYQFMLYLHDRFGLATLSALHRDGLRHGLAGVRAVLPAGADFYDVLHDFQTMTLVDKIVEEPGGTMNGVPAERVTAASLRSEVNLANETLYATPGVAPNGADYVPLPTPVTSVEFAGAETLPPLPIGWSIADQTFFSGSGGKLDSHAVRPVTVPETNPRLTLETAYDLENHKDYGYVTVSTDGGKTFAPVTGDWTTFSPWGPGLTGASGRTVSAGYDLRAYAGKEILLGLRYVSNGAGNNGGWRIGRIALGGQTLSDGSSLDGWSSPSALAPTPVHAWHVSLVGLDDKRAIRVPLEEFALLESYPKVVAIVAYDEPTEEIKQYAPYRLTVNGVLQHGGSTP